MMIAAAPVVCACGVQAQAPQRRIAAINPNQMVALRNTVSPRLATAVDQGRMNPSTPIEGMTMYFQPTAAQKAALDALLEAQQTPGSHYYHQWLTPQQYGSLFGMNDADLASVKAWLESQGFTIESVASGRNSITFSGTAGQVESAFATELHRYLSRGEAHFANATELSVPAALNGVVLSIRGLNDFRPKPQLQPHRQSTAQFTSAQMGGHFLTPGDVAVIYDINAAYNSGDTGSGQTIVVLGQSAIAVSDIEVFQKAAGLTVKDPTIRLTPSTGTSAKVQGDEAESDLDLEYASGIGRGATILFDYAGNAKGVSVYDALRDAVDNNLGGIISLSYGSCELDLAQTDFNTLEGITQQGASQGQSIVVASGDDGSTACYGDLTTNTTPTTQEKSLAVNFPASSAYATGVGGTEFVSQDVNGKNAGTYWQPASGSDLVTSALSYIPEVAWNDDPQSGSYANQNGAQYALSAGGGGASKFAPRPSWQAGVPGIPSGSFRLVPDISLNSSADVGGYLYCTSDQSAWSTGQQGSCTKGFRDSSSNGYLTAGGGTSFATPIFAGMVAILNQKAGSTQGLLNKQLYTLASNASTYAAAFHDITQGSNACTAGSSYCSSAGASEYTAAAGYDEATGLGSFDFNALTTAWTATTTTTGGGGGGGGTTGSPSFKLAAANMTVAAGSSASSNVTVTPVNAFTGTVSFTVTASPAMTNGCYAIGNASVAGSTAVTTTLTVYTSKSQCSGSGVHSFARGGTATASVGRGQRTPRSLPLGMTALAGVLLFGFRRVRQVARSRAWTTMALLALALTAGFAGGCGTSSGTASSSTTSTSSNVAAGSYTLTVTGTGSSVTASTTLSVTVQ
ncbi:MAG TPA: S53 family peptidase [Acidobacteriaceae bacterium]|nr:S53 family peptidase [Acidobacteriaceae bacterium]